MQNNYCEVPIELFPIFVGMVTPCGQGNYQVADGSAFVGKPPKHAIDKLKPIIDNPDAPKELRDVCKAIVEYSETGTVTPQLMDEPLPENVIRFKRKG